MGEEPSLNFSSFNGSLFDSNSVTTEIQAKFSGSDKKEEEVEVYFRTYELNKKRDLELTGVNSSEFGTPSNPTVVTINSSTYKINLPDSNLGEGIYSGSIGFIGASILVEVKYNLLFENLNQTEITSATSQLAVKLFDGAVQKANEVVDITGITQGTTENFTTYLSPSSDISDTILKFSFDGFEGDGNGSPDITLTITDINRISDDILIPSMVNRYNVLRADTYKKTILRKQVKPTPTNSTGYERLVDAKIYRLDTGEVYTTNKKGVVTNIE